MTLDVTTFIAEKDGDPEAIRESQKKRGNSVELVDEVIALYKEWVKSTFIAHITLYHTELVSVDFELNGLSKKINAIQKEIGAKKKANVLQYPQSSQRNRDPVG
jgi:seryl-tRNA synthetase